jgi:hypothetical protein
MTVLSQAIAAVIVHDPDRLAQHLGHQLLLAEECERAAMALRIVSPPFDGTDAL